MMLSISFASNLDCFSLNKKTQIQSNPTHSLMNSFIYSGIRYFKYPILMPPLHALRLCLPTLNINKAFACIFFNFNSYLLKLLQNALSLSKRLLVSLLLFDYLEWQINKASKCPMENTVSALHLLPLKFLFNLYFPFTLIFKIQYFNLYYI